MDIRQLRYFVAIVEAKSFSRAAIALRVAQPALSLHVRNMEADLGTTLLLRTPQGVLPTDAGRLLLERARSIIAEFEATLRAVAEHDSEPAGEVRLGLPGTLGEMLSVPLILAVRERFPKIRLKIAEAMSGYVLEWLYDGRVDLGLVYIPVDERGLRSSPILTEEMRLFAHVSGVAGIETPADGAVDLSTLHALPLVLPSVGHGLRSLLDEEIGRLGLELPTVIEVDSYSAIKEIVGRGLAYSVLPENAVAREPDTARFRTWPIGSPPLSRTVHLVRPYDRPSGKAAEAVEQLCVAELSKLVGTGLWKADFIER